jgi:glycyl-tRNA synthetase beta chain
MQVVVLRDKLEPVFAAGRYQEALVELAELRDRLMRSSRK